MIDFANPWMLTGLVAAFVPLLVHLLTRQRAPSVPFTALAFLMSRNVHRARALRVREWLLVAVRMAAIALVALALAKPLVPTLGADATVIAGGGPISLVLLVDDSMSMMSRDAEGQTRFARAQRRAWRLLERLPQGSEAALVLTGKPARVLEYRLTDDLHSVARDLEAAKHHPRADDAQRAIGLATQLMRSANHPDRRIVLIGDLQAAGWRDVTLPFDSAGSAAAAEPPVRFEAQRIGEPVRANTAIVDARAEPAPDQGAHQVRIDVEISHQGDEPFRGHATVRVGERELKSWIEIAPGARLKRSWLVSGMSEFAEVRLPDDDLPADNSRLIRLEGGAAVRVALIDGAPRPLPREDEVFFASRALELGVERAGELAVDTLHVSGLQAADLSSYDVVVLANVSDLSASLRDGLMGLVERGKGVLITMGDNLPADANETFGALLPARVAGVRAASNALHAGEAIRAEAAEAGGRPESSIRALRLALAGPTSKGLLAAKVWRHVLVEPSADVDRATVLRLASGAPVLLAWTSGRGMIALWTTSLDRDWTDLPLQPAFLPMLRRLVLTLGATAAGPRRLPLLPGEIASVPRHPQAESIEVRPTDRDGEPTGPIRRIAASTRSGDTWQVGGLLQPGRYLVREVAQGARWSEGSLLVVPPVAESEADLLDETALPTSQSPSGSGPQRPKVPGWSYAVLALVGLLVLEGMLLVRIRPSPGGPPAPTGAPQSPGLAAGRRPAA